MNIKNILLGNSWLGVLFHLVLIGIVGLTLLWYFFYFYLAKETRHGEGISTPSIVDLSIEDAQKAVENKGLELVIRDTVYSPKHNKSSIVTQLPKGGKRVKLGRKIYVDINTDHIPTVKFTKKMLGEDGGIVRTDVETAQITIKNLELVPEVQYIDEVHKDYVYGAEYKGEELEEGQELPLGSVVTIMTGNGNKPVDTLAKVTNP